jgi:ABC-type phosphate/phosphonate transport system substrate-binding protein
MCPWLPESFFRDFLAVWSSRLGEECELVIDLTSSGPTHCQVKEGSDPLSQGQVEAGLICAPTYLWSSKNTPPRVNLAGWTPVFDDVERPVYHSVVLARKCLKAKRLEDLRDVRWCFNDPCSLSGYFSVTTSLGGNTKSLLSRAQFSGGHTQSVDLLLRGEADACAVDSNGWLIHRELRQKAQETLAEIAKLGPYPAQPIVFSQRLTEERRDRLQRSLTETVQNPILLETLNQKYGLVRFVPTEASDFSELHARLTP